MTKKNTAVVVIDHATQDVIETPEDRLATIAALIKFEYGKGIDLQFAIGNLLIEAHGLMPDDREYGRWFAEQGFPFRKGTAFLLQRGAESEPEVRAFIASRGQENERDIGVPYAVQLLTAPPSHTKEQKDAERELGELSRTDDGFSAFRKGVYALLGYEVGEDGEGEWSKDLSMLANDELREVASLVSKVADAYTVEKNSRRG